MSTSSVRACSNSPRIVDARIFTVGMGFSGFGNPRSFSMENRMLRVTDGCTERQFPLVPQAVLVCSYDVVGTRFSDCRVSVTHSPCPSSKMYQIAQRRSGLSAIHLRCLTPATNPDEVLARVCNECGAQMKHLTDHRSCWTVSCRTDISLPWLLYRHFRTQIILAPTRHSLIFRIENWSIRLERTCPGSVGKDDRTPCPMAIR